MTLKLFVDSASDLPFSFYKENDVELIPLNIHIDDENYQDLVTIESKQLYEEIRAGKMPKTSQAPPQLFEQLFSDLAKSGRPGIYLSLSSELSGTYQTALMIKEQVKEQYPDLDLTIIDSKCVSGGYGMIVMDAIERIQRKETKEKIIQAIRSHCERMEHIFTVEDLDFLARGGRLSRASAFLGGLLNIKPLLHVEDGKLIPLEKIRGKKKLYRRMLDIMEERGGDLENQVIGISHGDDEKAALQIKKMIEERFGSKKFHIDIIGAVIAAHAGPGTLAIFFLKDE